jgi:hypothetical protein
METPDKREEESRESSETKYEERLEEEEEHRRELAEQLKNDPSLEPHDASEPT